MARCAEFFVRNAVVRRLNPSGFHQSRVRRDKAGHFIYIGFSAAHGVPLSRLACNELAF
jgi:hypothetical protein